MLERSNFDPCSDVTLGGNGSHFEPHSTWNGGGVEEGSLFLYILSGSVHQNLNPDVAGTLVCQDVLIALRSGNFSVR